MKTKIVLSIILSIAMASCLSPWHTGGYQLSLITVGGVGSDSAKVTPVTHSDKDITTAWIPYDKGFYFTIKNNSDKTARVNWNDALYVDETGTARKIIHSGIRLIDKDLPQQESIIPPGTSISEQAIPTDNISWTGSYWSTSALFGISYKTSDDIKGFNERFVGKQVTLYIPIRVGEVLKEYQFKFNVDKFIPEGS